MKSLKNKAFEMVSAEGRAPFRLRTLDFMDFLHVLSYQRITICITFLLLYHTNFELYMPIYPSQKKFKSILESMDEKNSTFLYQFSLKLTFPKLTYFNNVKELGL